LVKDTIFCKKIVTIGEINIHPSMLSRPCNGKGPLVD